MVFENLAVALKSNHVLILHITIEIFYWSLKRWKNCFWIFLCQVMLASCVGHSSSQKVICWLECGQLCIKIITFCPSSCGFWEALIDEKMSQWVKTSLLARCFLELNSVMHHRNYFKKWAKLFEIGSRIVEWELYGDFSLHEKVKIFRNLKIITYLKAFFHMLHLLDL